MIVYSVSTLSRTGCINIGYATETGVTQIGFDCSTWLERWPDMTVEVWVTAPGAASAYEAKTHRKGDVIVWEVMQSDTQTPGAGRVEVIGYTADKRKLSATVSTRIEDSMLMAEGTEPPEAQQPWYTAAQEAKARAEALARHAPIIEDGMWMLWDPDKGAYVNSGVQAQAGSGLPEGAGPWMQLVTGADGVARWEPRLAYAETEEAVILPETTVEWQGEDPEANLTTPFAAKMVAGQEYTVVWNGDEYKCVAQAEDNGEGLVAVVLGDTESFPFSIFQLPEEFAAQIGVYAFVQSAKLLTSATLSITGVAEMVKTIDPKFLPAGAGGGGGGGGGVIYVQEFSGDKENPSANPCFSDRELTQQMDYATGKAILLSGGWVCQPTEIDGMVFDIYLKPLTMFAVDDGKAAQVVLANPNTGEDFVQYHMGLVFSDSEA